MAPEPLSNPDGSGGAAPLNDTTADLRALRAERDALELRAEEAEEIAERLAVELGAAREKLAERPYDDDHLSLFDGAGTDVEPSRAADGSEPGIIPVALAGTGAVTLSVALLSLSNNGFLSPVTLIMAAATIGLGRAAWAMRVVGAHVTVVDGIVTFVQRGATHRFDLRTPATRIEVFGRPGDTDWRVRFYRRALDPCDVDATMVDPATFLARLREHRPDL